MYEIEVEKELFFKLKKYLEDSITEPLPIFKRLKKDDYFIIKYENEELKGKIKDIKYFDNFLDVLSRNALRTIDLPSGESADQILDDIIGCNNYLGKRKRYKVIDIELEKKD